MTEDTAITEQLLIDQAEAETLKANIKMLREQNVTLSEAYLKILMTADRYRTALEETRNILPSLKPKEVTCTTFI